MAGLAVAAVVVPDAGSARKHEPNGDIWKYRVPEQGVRAEFAGEDVMGVIAGQHIATDGSANVVRSAKIDGFTAVASRTSFEDPPDTNPAKAWMSWEHMKSQKSTDVPTQ